MSLRPRLYSNCSQLKNLSTERLDAMRRNQQCSNETDQSEYHTRHVMIMFRVCLPPLVYGISYHALLMRLELRNDPITLTL